MSVTGKDPRCVDSRPCFAQTTIRGGFKRCTVLTSAYEESNDCPFAKPDREVTDGVRYPYDTKYGKGE